MSVNPALVFVADCNRLFSTILLQYADSFSQESQIVFEKGSCSPLVRICEVSKRKRVVIIDFTARSNVNSKLFFVLFVEQSLFYMKSNLKTPLLFV
jgi:hypothetical protein